ncbi:MAG TPA: phosphodiester glycosidase family protein, partial [Ktedonobacteraceae bacterium]|nr:phosphodiester glycosidase family protein [Ktedonobacteraceae bacterium]
MTVFKKPIPGEDTSGHAHHTHTHTNVVHVYSNEGKIPPGSASSQGNVDGPDVLKLSLPAGKRQFIRPAVVTRHLAPSSGFVATIERTPARKQFRGPGVLPERPMPVPLVEMPEVFQISPLAPVHTTIPQTAPGGQLVPFTQASRVAPLVMAPQETPQLPVVTPAIAAPQKPEQIEEQPLRTRLRRGKRTQRKQKGKKPRRKRLRRLLIVVSILTVIAVVFFSQGNGAVGAWLADAMRAVLGPTVTAQVESWYLGLSDTTHNIQYQLGGQHVNAPWSVGTLPPTPVPPPTWSTFKPMPLAHIPSVVTPGITGEGIWYTQEQAPAPYNYLPLDAKAFIRPDPSHPYAIVTMLQFDMRFISLHMVAGTVEPGGPLNHAGPGVIPTADQQGNALLAAFNGGFKYADGQYGLMTNGVVYVPPQNGVATIAVTKEGKIILGAWGTDPRFTSTNHDLVAWRQNAALLINNGVINPLTSDGSAWGGTILNSAYTWRSGLGITASGTLIYAAGDYLTALTLGQALKAAGAVM